MNGDFKISFLDSNFPKEYKELFFKVEKLIMKRINCISYNIFYNIINENYEIIISFRDITISSYFDTRKLKYYDEYKIYFLIANHIKDTLYDIYFNDVEEK